MLKVIRQNTKIIDHDSRSIIEVVSVGEGRHGQTYCIEYDLKGNVTNDELKLYNHEISNIVFENYKARAVFRPEEDERKYYKIFISDNKCEFRWRQGHNLYELVSELSSKMLFDDELVAMIRAEYLTRRDGWALAYETPWIGRDYVQEIDDFYSDPRHGCYTLEECIEELRKTTSWI